MSTVLRAFDPYLEELEELVRARTFPDVALLDTHLDGEAGRRLRSTVGIEGLRTIGAFFTGDVLAKRLVGLVPEQRTRYLDPACGCGDLLLAASYRLEVQPSLEATLRTWNEHLAGHDLVPSFVRVARARLALAAITRGARATEDVRRPANLLTNVAVGNGHDIAPAGEDTAILLNPPYGRVCAPEGCRWTQGLTTEAAVFVDLLLDASGPGVHVAAVLPEVLRAGSRYDSFRKEIERRLAIEAIEPAGIFDALTDVDVFLLSGETHPRQSLAPGTWTVEIAGSRLEDICEVAVGAVVANRDPERGPWRLFLDARTRGRARDVWPTNHRRFRGSVLMPPFVVVGRTNRPDPRRGPRVRCTIVRGNREVAVENHLIALVPHDRTLRGCRAITTIVESQGTTEFLDRRLRCRHLTVRAMREIPL